MSATVSLGPDVWTHILELTHLATAELIRNQRVNTLRVKVQEWLQREIDCITPTRADEAGSPMRASPPSMYAREKGVARLVRLKHYAGHIDRTCAGCDMRGCTSIWLRNCGAECGSIQHWQR